MNTVINELTDASYWNNIAKVKKRIEEGDDIHIENDAPLRIACELGHFKIVKLLVENGANIHVNNNSPIDIAESFGNDEVVAYLKRKILKEKLLAMTED